MKMKLDMDELLAAFKAASSPAAKAAIIEEIVGIQYRPGMGRPHYTLPGAGYTVSESRARDVWGAVAEGRKPPPPRF